MKKTIAALLSLAIVMSMTTSVFADDINAGASEVISDISDTALMTDAEPATDGSAESGAALSDEIVSADDSTVAGDAPKETIPVTNGDVQESEIPQLDSQQEIDSELIGMGELVGEESVSEDKYASLEEIDMASSGGIEDFVTRLYKICFNRAPDTAGFNGWVDYLKSQNMTGGDVARHFIFSTEFKNLNLCNSCFLRYMYLCMFGREPDTVGWNNWIGFMANGMTHPQVFSHFVKSEEWTNICASYGIKRGDGFVGEDSIVPVGKCTSCGKDSSSGVTGFVTRLYKVCLDRTPDAGGLAAWSKELLQGASNGSAVSSGFIFSPEFKAKNFCNEHYLRQLYRAFMGREADAEGLRQWKNQLDSGKMNREGVFNGFANSAEFTDICKQYGIKRGDGIPVPSGKGTVPTGSCSACTSGDGSGDAGGNDGSEGQGEWKEEWSTDYAFDAKNGTPLQYQKITGYKNTITGEWKTTFIDEPPTPVRDGYKFIGWYANKGAVCDSSGRFLNPQPQHFPFTSAGISRTYTAVWESTMKVTNDKEAAILCQDLQSVSNLNCGNDSGFPSSISSPNAVNGGLTPLGTNSICRHCRREAPLQYLLDGGIVNGPRHNCACGASGSFIMNVSKGSMPYGDSGALTWWRTDKLLESQNYDSAYLALVDGARLLEGYGSDDFYRIIYEKNSAGGYTYYVYRTWQSSWASNYNDPVYERTHNYTTTEQMTEKCPLEDMLIFLYADRKHLALVDD